MVVMMLDQCHYKKISISKLRTIDSKLVISLIISFALNIIVVYFLVQIHKERNVKTTPTDRCSYEDRAVYLPCPHLNGQVGVCITDKNDVMNGFRRLVLSEANLCLIQMVLLANRTNPSGATDDMKSNMVFPYRTRPAANIVLNTTNLKDDMLKWINPDQVPSFKMMDMSYRNHSLRIPDNGTYFVYSMFTLRSKRDNKPEVLHHNVYRKSRHRKKSVLFTKSLHRTEGVMAFQTSVISGIVKLKRGESIYPSISNTSAVYQYSVTSQWGAYKMDI